MMTECGVRLGIRLRRAAADIRQYARQVEHRGSRLSWHRKLADRVRSDTPVIASLCGGFRTEVSRGDWRSVALFRCDAVL